MVTYFLCFTVFSSLDGPFPEEEEFERSPFLHGVFSQAEARCVQLLRTGLYIAAAARLSLDEEPHGVAAPQG